MTQTLTETLDEWQETWDHLQDCAVTALCLALPGLGRAATPPYCCPVTLHIDKPGDLGAGRVCIDTDARATIEIGDIPNSVIAEAADAVFGIGWFDVDSPLEDADPDTYTYSDETTGAEWELTIGDENTGTGKLLIECVTVPDGAALLAAITAARTRQLNGESAAAGSGEAGTLTA
ncbi:hypothetical protein AB0G49_14335 [Streptomyces longwoodensis]|uniref:hypothetical protein n=1 Tax=Streptomyces longwoodensis TaxID=68231 RepID=UPI0033C3A1C5